MRTALSTLELLEPKTLTTALKLMRAAEPPTPIAGCTDVYVELNFGTRRAGRFLDLSQLGALRKITKKGDLLSIGALATYREIIGSRLIKQRVPMLVAASREIGGPQIQARGTLGGNVANASPAGDTLPVLSVAEATIVLASVDGERRISFNDFYTGYRTSVRRPDELIIAVEIPPVDGKQWFRKVGTRAAQAISKIVMAGVRPIGAPPRIALGSVAPTVVRLPRTETALAAGVPGDGLHALVRAQQVLGEEIHPIDDLRSTAEYRLRVAKNLLVRFWTDTA